MAVFKGEGDGNSHQLVIPVCLVMNGNLRVYTTPNATFSTPGK